MTRVESWSFFSPPPGGGDPDYTLAGNRATLGIHVDGRRFAFQGSVRYAQLLNLPRDAFDPGPLGPGALYYAAARAPAAYQLYFKTISLRVKNVVSGLSIEAGRMIYESGSDTPFRGRLIGTAPWTVFERSFDGARVDYGRGSWKAHASFVMPTQGAFEESANPTIEKVQLSTARWTRGRIDVFAHHYRDTRGISARPDNTGLAASAIDVSVRTLGGSLAVGTARPRGGVFAQGWGALQRGTWYGQQHRASSGVAEGGYRWPGSREASLSGGISYASGDDAASDDAHETFFPMVPTTSPGLLGGTFAEMNLREVYAQARLKARSSVTVSGGFHRLWLASARDRWYGGTGATSLRGNYFGFSVRPSRLATSLATYATASLEAVVHPVWTIGATAGVIKGGEIVRRQFSGTWSTVLLIESRITLGVRP